MRHKRRALVNIFTEHPFLPEVLNFLCLEFAGLVFCGRTNSIFVLNFPRLVKRKKRRAKVYFGPPQPVGKEIGRLK